MRSARGHGVLALRGRLGLAGGSLREIALYGQTDERWRRFTPHVYGTAWDEERGHGLVVLERLARMYGWTPARRQATGVREQIEAAVRGLAELHAIWFDREAELAGASWLGPIWTAGGMAEMTDLWEALASHAARFFVPWLGSPMKQLHRRLLVDLEQWWRPLDQLPRTLIHNDFNSRNIALRHNAGSPTLCAYDWELATLGVPQHDLAELLCFVLPFDCSRETVRHYVELHRRALEEATGRKLDAEDWRHGFALSLADLLVNRWSMYTLVHAIRPQAFLERVLRTWQTLHTYQVPMF